MVQNCDDNSVRAIFANIDNDYGADCYLSNCLGTHNASSPVYSDIEAGHAEQASGFCMS